MIVQIKINYGDSSTSFHMIDEYPTIKYGDKTIFSFSSHGTKTLKCFGKRMSDDIYVGNKKLTCKNQKMNYDVVISCVVQEKWKFNYLLNMNSITFNVPFVSNGESYNKIRMLGSYRLVYGASKEVWNADQRWNVTSGDYRTILLDEPATGSFKDWLEQNAQQIS